MSKIVLVTGGTRSGKSAFAEKLLVGSDKVLYIATAVVTDEEMKDRVKKHRDRRNSNWETFEGYSNLDVAINNFVVTDVLLDCVTIMSTNLMFDKKSTNLMFDKKSTNLMLEKNQNFDSIEYDVVDDIIKNIKEEFSKLISKVREMDINLIMVTNELGMGLVPENKLGRVFRDIQGIINQYVAELSDEVYFVACGLPIKLKSEEIK